MDFMKVEQAIFTSSDRGRMKGYQLVSASAGVDREASQDLSRWSPTKFLTDRSSTWTINSFPVAGDRFAVSRTVLGGPEYSGRGAAQVVTAILLLERYQLASYDYNAVALARTAMAMGYLRFRLGLEGELGQAVLPSQPIPSPSQSSLDYGDESETRVLDEVRSKITQSHRVAVIGIENPLDAVDRLIKGLPVESRDQFSFTTGLAPAIRRPFQAHFYKHLEPKTRRILDSQDIALVSGDNSNPKLTLANRPQPMIARSTPQNTHAHSQR